MIAAVVLVFIRGSFGWLLSYVSIMGP